MDTAPSETVALGWTGRDVYVRMPDSPWKFTAVRARRLRREAQVVRAHCGLRVAS
jgi:hypothetical protein